jgi:phage-related tail protein
MFINKEFFVNVSGKPALCFNAAVDDIVDEKYGNHDDLDEYFDAILDQLSRIHTENFVKKYPEQYDKYYCQKLITSKHITIKYNYLIASFEKICCSNDGFTINDIAMLIQKQHKKMCVNHKKSITSNKIPKYFPIDISTYNISLRFTINVSNDIPKINVYHV